MRGERLAAVVASLVWGFDPNTAQELVGALAVYRRWSAANNRPVSEGLQVLAAHLESAEARSAATSGQQWPAESQSVRQQAPAGENGAKFYTAEEVARVLNVSVSTIRRRIASGDLPAVKVGQLTRIHPDDFDAYIAENRS